MTIAADMSLPAQPILALTFAAPLMLIGLVAAAIPFLLHLMSRVRAQEQHFPTLRFLKITMERTARRRRLQNWLLLLLRSLLLAVLAMAVAEPISQATGGWLGASGEAAVLLVDNSYSMAARPASAGRGEAERFARATAAAEDLLSGERKPALACLLNSTGPTADGELTSRLETLRKALAAGQIDFGATSLAGRFSRAVETLNSQSNPRKAIYVFCDFQRLGWAPLLKLSNLPEAKDTHLFIVNCAPPAVNNVGITDVQIDGGAIVGGRAQIVATVRNSSPAGRTVELVLRIDGAKRTQKVIRQLAAAGKAGDTAEVRFGYRFSQAGPVTGEVRLTQDDDLLVDNVRRFALTVGPKLRALVIRGQAPPDADWWVDPTVMLHKQLDWRTPAQREQMPWPIRANVIDWQSLSPEKLADADVAFFCEVPTFSAAAARAVDGFVRRGGTAVFFLGPEVQPASYNQHFAPPDGLLPAKLGPPSGQVGSDAPSFAMRQVDIEHPYLAGLFAQPGDYLAEPLLVQRYFKLAGMSDGTVLMRLENGDPLIVARKVGRGEVVLCTAPASLRWSPNLPTHGLFLPMIHRITHQSRKRTGGGLNYIAGRTVTITPNPAGPQPTAGEVEITLPEKGATASLSRVPLGGDGSARFDKTAQPGVYRWQLRDTIARGVFVVNPSGPESDLTSFSAEDLRAGLAARGLTRVYIGETLTEVHAAAAVDSRGKNWWDVLIIATIMVLLAEALVANRKTQHQPPRK